MITKNQHKDEPIEFTPSPLTLKLFDEASVDDFVQMESMPDNEVVS